MSWYRIWSTGGHVTCIFSLDGTANTIPLNCWKGSKATQEAEASAAEADKATRGTRACGGRGRGSGFGREGKHAGRGRWLEDGCLVERSVRVWKDVFAAIDWSQWVRDDSIELVRAEWNG